MTTKFIIESFWQKKSNCVSVAFMKSMLVRHGLHFGYHKKQKGKYLLVSLKDGKVLSFTNQELRLINNKNQISFARYRDRKSQQLIKKIREHVALTFAIMVRNLQVRGYAGKELTQSQAINLLTQQGADTTHFHSLVGLKRKSSNRLTKKNFELIRHKRNVLLFNDRHITICSYGLYEDFGTARKLGEEVPVFLGRKIDRWFEIK